MYAADFTTPKVTFTPQLQQLINITLADKDYFPSITQNVAGKAIDLLVHSPGGFAEATESIVSHLRSQFDEIRVLVPGAAKSAATMLAMSANVLVMDELSELGPTDPQMVINGRYSPAGAILKQFETAERELRADPAKIAAWMPVLQQYSPSILQECRNHLDLAQRLVADWLTMYMFAGEADAREHAEAIAKWLASDENFLSHGRRIGIEELQAQGLKIVDLRTDAVLREAIREVYLTLMHTFVGTGAYKLFENSEGASLALSIVVQAISPQPPAPQ